MLALTRKKDQAIIISGNIEIKILDIQEGKVKLGITAPKALSIYREEVYLEIEKSNKEATRQIVKEQLKDLSILVAEKNKKN